jgi:hypothetical protein
MTEVECASKNPFPSNEKTNAATPENLVEETLNPSDEHNIGTQDVD